MLTSTPVSRAGVRTNTLLLIGVAAVLALSGCSPDGVRTDLTLLDAALLTQDEVTSIVSDVPVEWLVGDDEFTPTNNSSYCGSTIDAGPRGSATWTFAVFYDLTEPVSNDTLLTLLAPVGDQWVLRPSDDSRTGAQKRDYDYDGPDMSVNVFLNGEDPTAPRVAVSATSHCVLNGDTGPGTFPTPKPSNLPPAVPRSDAVE
ncbi:hypothetical protein RCH12_001353 [Cryobacterium sp. MP_3.1]|uniref:hypothetical protein n=1 Tax=Cryobacterium sp. MP_3.1 TaxID=3071711 RepID=UPI002E0941B0|nr:hypothetical protein [Cryobacterium sp. MP_3.1]